MNAEGLSGMLALARKDLDAHPQSATSWGIVGGMLLSLGRRSEAIDVLAEGLSVCPDSSLLHLSLARALASVGRFEEALASCDAVTDGQSETKAARALRFELLIKLQRFAEASEMLGSMQAINPCEPYIFKLLEQDMRTPDKVQKILDACETALSANANCTNALYYKAISLAKLGRVAAAREILSVDRGVAVRQPELPLPAAVGGDFLTALSAEICAQPELEEDPRGLATRNGRQTPPLVPTSGPAIAALLALIKDEVDRYAASDGNSALAKARLVAWAVVCGGDGKQLAHTHKTARLSGVFYVQAPKSAGRYQGPLLLGALDPALGVEPPWGVRSIEPLPGRLIIFPSYVPHATEPSGCPGERISVAFDVIPS